MELCYKQTVLKVSPSSRLTFSPPPDCSFHDRIQRSKAEEHLCRCLRNAKADEMTVSLSGSQFGWFCERGNSWTFTCSVVFKMSDFWNFLIDSWKSWKRQLLADVFSNISDVFLSRRKKNLPSFLLIMSGFSVCVSFLDIRFFFIYPYFELLGFVV